jgi:transcriptional regulator with XRE-family HTH domain
MLRFRGRTRLTQRQLAVRLGVTARSIQAWEAGESYPSTASLQALISVYLDEGVFSAGSEAAAAASLWTSALEHSSRLRPPFEHAWFDDLLASKREACREEGVMRPQAPHAFEDARLGCSARRRRRHAAPHIAA